MTDATGSGGEHFWPLDGLNAPNEYEKADWALGETWKDA